MDIPPKAIGMKIIDSGPRAWRQGCRIKFSLFWTNVKKVHYFENFANFQKFFQLFSQFSDNPIMFGLKMIGLTRAIQICSHFIIHLIPAQTIAI